jgi:putative endonuclease
VKTPATGGRAARRRGVFAEQMAAGWLRLKEYRVLARDFVHPLGEIDIVAPRGDTIAFIEVKYRATAAAAGEAIDMPKRRRATNAARAWLAAHPANGDHTIRFDAILMVPWRLPIHICDAWRM